MINTFKCTALLPNLSKNHLYYELLVLTGNHLKVKSPKGQRIKEFFNISLLEVSAHDPFNSNLKWNQEKKMLPTEILQRLLKTRLRKMKA